VLTEDSDAEVAGPSEWRESVQEVPAKAPGELGKSEDHRRQRIAGAEHLTGVGFGSNSGVGRARGLMQKPRTAS
jgi:hypothetical protein